MKYKPNEEEKTWFAEKFWQQLGWIFEIINKDNIAIKDALLSL